MADERWLVAGLGNPGADYAATRHNVGFQVADLLAERQRATFKAHKGRASVCETRVEGVPAVLVKPLSYMNESGGPVASVSAFYKVPADRLVVVHDEIDLPFGALRVKCGGGDNGHNGLKSIRRSLGGGEWFRVRIGVGRGSGRADVATHVLKGFSAAERKELPFVLDRAADAVGSLLTDGLERTQNAYND
ncbi:MAG TPA: aminoacyl-tRNA hydrolase [Mycobacteriales bacterium]